MIKCRSITGRIAACLAAIMLLATGCADGIPIVSEIRETESYSDAQMMILITTEKNRYSSVYGTEIWDVAIGDTGENFQSHLVGEIRSFLHELKTMNLLADEHGIELTSQEKEELKKLSTAYYTSLSEDDITYMGIQEEDAYHMYEQYHRANKLVTELTRDVNLEISDSEAKVIAVQEIKLDNAGTAQSVYEQVTAEGADFTAIARASSSDSVIDKQVGRSERSRAYEDVVFQLQAGEIGQPIQENEQEFVIVKCISDYDEAATLERKQRLSLQRKNQAFRQIYETYVAEHKVEIKSDIWEQISFTTEDKSTTTSFFELYHEYMNY
ncbi:MAG: peptidylprolyl isomerase [Lachnospiraceae bacterium]